MGAVPNFAGRTDGVATMVKDNQDHFKRAGRPGGPPGPRSQFKARLTRTRARLLRDEEHVLPGERPRAGRRRSEPPVTATEAAEADLAALHGSALDHLPKPVGAAGLPQSARPIHEGEEPAGRTFTHGPFAREVAEEEAPYGYAIPASEDAAVGRPQEPFARERAEMRHAARRSAGLERTLVRRFSPILRLVGEAARAIDRPVRGALDTLQRLGREARKPT